MTERQELRDKILRAWYEQDFIMEDNQTVFAVREETDDCLTSGCVAVFQEEDGWKGISVTEDWKFLVEHVTDDSKTIKVTCDSWYDALKA